MKTMSMRQLIETIHSLDKLPPENSFSLVKPITNYWNYAYGSYKIFPRIVCMNLDGKKYKGHIEFFSAIKNFNPHIIFLIECWKLYPELPNYVRLHTNDIYMNHIFIRSDIARNRPINRIPYGFRIEDIYFRYIKPHSKKCELFQNEIGDFNFGSNKWIKEKDINEFYREQRTGKPGGLGFRLNKDKEYGFYTIDSDHKALWIEIKEFWNKNLVADKRKLANAIDAIMIDNATDFKYFYKSQNNLRYRINNDIINPNTFNLEDWRKLYKDKPNKLDKQSNKLGFSINQDLKPYGTKAYDANNRPTKLITDYIRKKTYSNQNLEKFINVLNKDPCNSRIICLKKNDEIKSLDDVRPISIMPISIKIKEHSRLDLKNKLISRTNKRIKSFMPKSSIHDVLVDIHEMLFVKDNG